LKPYQKKNLKAQARAKSVAKKLKIARNLSNSEKGIRAAKLLASTINKFYPELASRLRQIEDPRKQRHYPIEDVIFAAIAMFILKCGSRNAMNALRDKNMAHNFKLLFGFNIPHMDSVDDVINAIKTEDLEELRVALVRALIERKVLKPVELDGKVYLVAIDATGVMTATENDEGTLKKESKNGVISYSRMVLEAKIIMPGGFAISISSEWIATDQQDTGTKEDCELNAFKRLSEKIKKYFPQLPICMLVDGLYPSEPFIKICQEKNWNYCAVLKDKKLKDIWNQVDESLLESERTGAVENMILTNDGGTVEWVNGIKYRKQILSWLEFDLIADGAKHRFVTITNITINHDIAELLVRVGRSRWGIEDAFNTQKNRGYELSHKYSRGSFNATKNYYILMQIGHMFSQLVEYCQHFQSLKKGSKVSTAMIWKFICSALVFVVEVSKLQLDGIKTQHRYSFV
jgi:hypothetical protein